MHEKEKDEAWEQSNTLMAHIAKNGGFKKHVEKNKDLISEAFPKKVSCVCCMDGRVTADGVRVAGSGILLGKADRELLIQQLIANHITEISRHPGCGAEGLYIKSRMAEGAPREIAEKEIEEWIAYLQKRTGAGFKEVPLSSEFHNERTIYYDFTGTFNPSHASGIFPPGFVISRNYPHADAAIESAKIGIGIATGDGDHSGYGNRFDKKNPFILVVVANNAAELADGQKELESLASKDVKVEGFIKPKTK